MAEEHEDVAAVLQIEAVSSTSGVSAEQAKEAWAYRNEALGYTSDASMYKSQADAINPTLSAVGTLLTSGAQVADRWQTYKSVKG